MSIQLRSAVVLITGVMASGKSTVAGLLAERLPRAAHVRGDTFRRMLVSGREEPLPEETAEARAQLDLRQRRPKSSPMTMSWTTAVHPSSA